MVATKVRVAHRFPPVMLPNFLAIHCVVVVALSHPGGVFRLAVLPHRQMSGVVALSLSHTPAVCSVSLCVLSNQQMGSGPSWAMPEAWLLPCLPVPSMARYVAQEENANDEIHDPHGENSAKRRHEVEASLHSLLSLSCLQWVRSSRYAGGSHVLPHGSAGCSSVHPLGYLQCAMLTLAPFCDNSVQLNRPGSRGAPSERVTCVSPPPQARLKRPPSPRPVATGAVQRTLVRMWAGVETRLVCVASRASVPKTAMACRQPG
jgi:hypothetical protein